MLNRREHVTDIALNFTTPHGSIWSCPTSPKCWHGMQKPWLMSILSVTSNREQHVVNVLPTLNSWHTLRINSKKDDGVMIFTMKHPKSWARQFWFISLFYFWFHPNFSTSKDSCRSKWIWGLNKLPLCVFPVTATSLPDWTMHKVYIPLYSYSIHSVMTQNHMPSGEKYWWPVFTHQLPLTATQTGRTGNTLLY